MSERPSNPNNLPEPDEADHRTRREPTKSPNEQAPQKDPRRTEPGREAPTDIEIEKEGYIRLGRT